MAYFYYVGNLWGVLVFYLLFWFLDLIDGALARYLGVQNDKGRFFDSVVDNFMYGFAILGFIYLGIGFAWLLAYNILIEYITQLLITVKKCKKLPTDWLIHIAPDAPYFKTLGHAALLLFVFGFNVINPVFFVLNTWLTLTAVYYLIIINQQV